MPAYRSDRTVRGAPQAAARALWRATGTAEGDLVALDIPARGIALDVGEDERARRRQAMSLRNDGGWKPRERSRRVSRALRAYAVLARSAAFGAVRDPSLVDG